MRLTEKQKNCPYCHIDKDGAIKLIINAENEEDYIMNSDSLSVYVDGEKLAYDAYVARGDFDANTLDSEFCGLAKISYCPMCGRPLNEEEE